MHKKWLILAALVPGVLILLFLIGKVFSSKNVLPNLGEVVSSVVKPTGSAAGPTASGPTATLIVESGDVSYKLPNSDYQKTTFEQIDLPTGSSVKTGEGLAHVVFPDDSMASVAENSEIAVSFSDTAMSISQLIGRTFHRVSKVVSGHSYEVETPTTVATVRGTEFGVDIASADDSTVYVTESTVDVAQVDHTGGARIIKNTLKVAAGNQTQIPKFTPLIKLRLEALKETLKNDPWLTRNQKISEFRRKYKARPHASAKEEGKEVLNEIKTDQEIQQLDTIRLNKRKSLNQNSSPAPSPGININNSPAQGLKTKNINIGSVVNPTPSPSSQALAPLTSSANIRSQALITLTPSPTPSPVITSGLKAASVGTGNNINFKQSR
jgi:hypothetical protein